MNATSSMTASVTRPPALRTTGASPSSTPRNAAGSVRGSRQVTMNTGWRGMTASPAWAPVAAKVRLRSRSARRLDMDSSGDVLSLLVLDAPSPARSLLVTAVPLARALRERYEFRPPQGVTRRCLPGVMSLRGDRTPEGATGLGGGPGPGVRARPRVSRLHRLPGWLAGPARPVRPAELSQRAGRAGTGRPGGLPRRPRRRRR